MNNIYQPEIRDFMHTDSEKQLEITAKLNEMISGKKVIIYGAGAIGTTLYHVLAQIGKTPEFYVDRRADEIESIFGIPVKDLSSLSEADHEEYLIVIAVYSGMILTYLDSIKELLVERCPNASVIEDGRTLAYILQAELCRRKAERGEKFDLLECNNCGFEKRGCEIYMNQMLLRAGIDPASYQKRKFEQFFGLILGDVCTLKCKHCNEMVPYHTTHTFHPVEQILKDCRTLLDSCTFMPWVECVGGEPLLHPQLKELLRELLAEKKIGYIKVFTNGTVVPDDELCALLANERVIINFSNYTEAVSGTLLENIYATRRQFEKHQIRYINSYARVWQTFDFEDNHKDEAELQKSLSCCSCEECHRLSEGVLYRCHHQYAGAKLGKIPIKEDDIIRIYDYDKEALRQRTDFFENRPYILACRYCNWPFDAQTVPAAEQLD